MNLAYACVYHSPKYLQLISLLLTSLSIYSPNSPNVDILIVTSEEFQPKIQQMFVELGLNNAYTWVKKIESSVIQAACARLHIFDYPNIDKYKKILYLDTDILITNQLSPIFNIQLKSDKIYTLMEGNTKDPYHGIELFRQSQRKNPEIKAFTTGILLFKNSEENKNFIRNVLKHIKMNLKYIENKNKVTLDNKQKSIKNTQIIKIPKPFSRLHAVSLMNYTNNRGSNHYHCAYCQGLIETNRLKKSLGMNTIDKNYPLLEAIPTCIDQPYFIFHAIIEDCYDNQKIKPYVINNPKLFKQHSVSHFPGGTGKGERKIPIMSRYLILMLNEHLPNNLPQSKLNLVKYLLTPSINDGEFDEYHKSNFFQSLHNTIYDQLS